MQRTTQTLTASDGHRFDLSVFRPPQYRASLLFLPAMGVRAQYYAPFAEELAARGLRVGIADLRGLGTSSLRPARDTDFGYEVMMQRDLPVAHEAMKDGSTLYLGGHSLGGQFAALTAARLEPAGLALVAACIPYHRGFGTIGGLRLRYLAAPLFPRLGRLVGHFPGDKVGFGGREARTLIADWARSVRTGQYRIDGQTQDYEEALAQVTCPMLAVEIAGDDWAPRAAIDYLVAKMKQCDVVHVRAKTDTPRHPHFGWAQDHGAVVDAIDQFIGD